ncbi:MAG: histidinol-phosphatase HisJ family protein [Clostridiales bacterium]|nr:histidinol-phosphatase HisJ family protein [Clostridiales bacterium]
MPSPIPMDIHSHSEHSIDGSYTVKKMCESAWEKGVAVYAITDHYEIATDQDDYAALDLSLSRSLAETAEEKTKYSTSMKILTGVELGQPMQILPKVEILLRDNPLDFVLGSLHNVPFCPDFYYYKPDDESQPWDKHIETYFSILLDMISWGGFDSAAHLTYPFRYILLSDAQYPIHKWDDHLDAVVKALADKGLAMELNTSGVYRRPSHMIPEARWVKRFKELGGEKLTLGADAHAPNHVGEGIPEGIQIALEAGFRWLCYFERRAPQFIKL